MPISQMTIQEKFKSIFENLKREDIDEFVKDVTFQGSQSWFEKFQKSLQFAQLKNER